MSKATEEKARQFDNLRLSLIATKNHLSDVETENKILAMNKEILTSYHQKALQERNAFEVNLSQERVNHSHTQTLLDLRSQQLANLNSTSEIDELAAELKILEQKVSQINQEDLNNIESIVSDLNSIVGVLSQ